MLQIGAGEFVVIALVALLVLGPEKLPHAARYVGQLVGSARSMASTFQEEMQRASDGLTEQNARERGQLQVDLERAAKAADKAKAAEATDSAEGESSAASDPSDTDVSSIAVSTNSAAREPDRTEKPHSATMSSAGATMSSAGADADAQATAANENDSDADKEAETTSLDAADDGGFSRE